jgi:hypothetical protein
MKVSVLTTIQAPTASVIALAQSGRRVGVATLAIGDAKSPDAAWPAEIEFVPVAAQAALGLRLGALLPLNHYSRKNLGYLAAIARGVQALFDTDDDNAPLPHWAPPALERDARTVRTPGWVNVYRAFSDEAVWPRGFPLQRIRESQARDEGFEALPIERAPAPVQQGLVNGEPDVDALWRLLQAREITFREGLPVWLAPGCWCPFNSQSTWWFPAAYPLLYLPSFVSFRMTDIWRSFVAQRCLWEAGYGVIFDAPASVQDRNAHDLTRDFEQEVPGYLSNERIGALLENLTLSPGAGACGENLRRCYAALVAEGIVPAEEMPLVEAWLADVDATGACAIA